MTMRSITISDHRSSDSAPKSLRPRSLTTALGSIGAVLGAGALACVACCALPLVLTAVGFGSAGAASALSANAEPYIAGAGAVIGLIGLVTWRRRRSRANASACGETSSPSCATDRSCGCAKPAAVRRDAESRECTLSLEDTEPRIEMYRRVFAELLGMQRKAATLLVLQFRSTADIEMQVRELARLESRCCSFMESHVQRDDSAVTWELGVPRGSEAALDAFAKLPDRIAQGMTVDEGRALLDSMNRALRG